ncbi:MAG: helix-turn-helix transcriptional regulator [Desulfuromonadales bacterium]
MTLGEKIRESRRVAGITRDELAHRLGISPAAITKIENNNLKFGPTPEALVELAKVLDDRSILIYALLNNPICKEIIPRAFTPLNNIKTDPSAILTKLREELDEAKERAEILARLLAHMEPESQPGFRETLYAGLEQLIDVPRCIEELFDKLKVGGVLSEEEHLEIHLRQQAKVEANGHHKRVDG